MTRKEKIAQKIQVDSNHVPFTYSTATRNITKLRKLYTKQQKYDNSNHNTCQMLKVMEHFALNKKKKRI